MEETRDKTVDKLIATYVAPDLKSAGFKRSGSTFRRNRGDLVDVVNVQSNSGNTHRSKQFTINLGIYHDPTAKAVAGNLAPKQPYEYDCQVRDRIGHILDGRDIWWEITTHTQFDVLGGEVRAAVMGAGLAFFERFPSLKVLFEHYRQNTRIPEAPVPGRTLAALACYVGDRQAAVRYLEGTAAWSKLPPAQVRRQAADTAKCLGLSFAPIANEAHGVLEVTASADMDKHSAIHLAKKIRVKIYDALLNQSHIYLHEWSDHHPVYRMDVYGSSEAEIRVKLAETLAYAQQEFETVELYMQTNSELE